MSLLLCLNGINYCDNSLYINILYYSCVHVINVYTCTLGWCIHNRVVKVLSISTLYLIYYILCNTLLSILRNNAWELLINLIVLMLTPFGGFNFWVNLIHDIQTRAM